MPIPPDVMEELINKRAAEHSAARRDTIRDLVLTAALCLGWGALGIFLILLAAHLTDAIVARVAFYGGIAIGNGGIIFTLLNTYRRLEKRGDL